MGEWDRFFFPIAVGNMLREATYGGGEVGTALYEIDSGARFDVRDHVTGKPFFRNTVGKLHNLEFSVTFSFLF